MPHGKGKGRCFGCGTKLERQGSWCHTKDQAGCRPGDWDERLLHLQMDGQLAHQRTVPAGDPEAMWAAALELQALALGAPSVDASQFSHQPLKPRGRALRWRIRTVEHDGMVTLYLDCMGHKDGPWAHPASYGTAVRWSPLVRAPKHKRRGPHPPWMADEDAGHYNHTPMTWERLAVGFAMLEGYESPHRMREERR